MTAKYKLIATKIIEYINSDKCKSKKLPTERELSQIYGVSRPTIRQALDLLLKENYIYKRQGSGIYVSNSLYSLRNHIVLLTESEEDYIFPEIISTLAAAFYEHGFKLDVHVTDGRIDKEREILLSVLESPVRGIISIPFKSAIPNPNIMLYGKLSQKHIPTLFFTDCYDNSFACIRYDDFYDTYRLVSRLYTESDDIYGIFVCDSHRSLNRYQGYIEGLLEKGKAPDDDHILWLTSDCFNEYRTTGRILRLNDLLKKLSKDVQKNNSIICHNDEIASALCDLIKDKELLPHIYSFDKSYLSRLEAYSYESFSYPVKEAATRSVRLMMQLINGEKVGEIIV